MFRFFFYLTQYTNILFKDHYRNLQKNYSQVIISVYLDDWSLFGCLNHNIVELRMMWSRGGEVRESLNTKNVL
jgi:hypothetical protein